ncbi:MAG: TonB-dependent receptor [Woeseiaceae bacterium]|nr:TonB-dependent receptor [Woeseiaceae bacterium]
MKDKSRFVRSKLAVLQRLSLAVLTACMVMALPVASNAQETTSAIRGSILAPDGGPAADVSVRVTDTRTGRTATTTTSSSGRFTIGSLSVGGPYTISLTSPNYASQTITDVNVALGETFDFSLTLTAESIEEIVVMASAIESVQVAIGPSSSFDFEDLQNLPSINRDINDVVRIDPRIYIDEAFVDSVQCVGANPRFNSLTVDGVKKNDNFGLNSNGYPTQRMPFPFDAIQNVSVELSPYAVQYGGFTACNINAVTRSGTNEFKGRAWVSYGGSDYTGDTLEGDSIPLGDYDETRYGVSIGGPIVEDKLFFFAAYEKSDGADTFGRCAADESCAAPVEGVTRAQLERIRNIAINDYGYDPGDDITSAPNEDEKLLLRFDWNINENHNAVLTYNYNDGFNITDSDDDADEYEFSNHYYERGAELNAWSTQLFSDWTDNFSTELRIGYSELDNRQNSVTNTGPLPGDEAFAEMQIETYADADGDGNFTRAIVYLGGDDSRQANVLNYDTFNLKLEGAYVMGDHVISAGYEQEEYNIYNLFIQHNIGEYRFDESRTDFNGNPVGCNSSRPDGCIDQFENFSPDDVYYGNTPSLNPLAGAPEFGYTNHTLYVQDEFTLPQADVTIVAGLRYDWYSSSDLPRENASFIARNGYSNSQNFDGESLIQPRFGFTWDVSDRLSLRGGAGLYSGGNPNVWLSNNYSNDGFSVIQAREGDCDDMQVGDCIEDMNLDPNNGLNTIPLGEDGNGRPGYDAPQALINYVQGAAGNSGVNGIDPNFKIPSNWKYSLGGTWIFDSETFGDGYVVSGDIIFSRARNSAIVRDATLIPFSTAPDGRTVYFQGDRSVAGCATDPVGTGFGTCGRRFTSDFILGNVEGDDAESLSISATLSKEHDNGIKWTLGYAYTESDDVSPMTSSVAFSNWVSQAVLDYNNPELSTSNYEIPHRFVLRFSYENEFFGDYTTRFSLFGQHNEGRPYSFTFFEQAMFIRQDFFFGDDDRSLLYMPTGPNDPLVVFDPGFDQAAFFEYAEANGLTGYGGSVVPRNTGRSDWWTKFDLRISQEIPGFTQDHYANLYFTIENLGNLLNDDWGVLYERDFPRTAPIVDASYVDVNGTPNDYSDDLYSFNEFIPQEQTRSADASLWQIRFGFNYNF